MVPRRATPIGTTPSTTPKLITRDGALTADGVGEQQQPQKAGPPPLCLLDAQRRFVGAPLAKLLTDNTDFVVVGVVGAQGAGKSSLLSDICGASLPSRVVRTTHEPLPRQYIPAPH
jgi:hypothetical protein